MSMGFSFREWPVQLAGRSSSGFACALQLDRRERLERDNRPGTVGSHVYGVGVAYFSTRLLSRASTGRAKLVCEVLR